MLVLDPRKRTTGMQAVYSVRIRSTKLLVRSFFCLSVSSASAHQTEGHLLSVLVLGHTA
jgi:hypothetical protein